MKSDPQNLQGTVTVRLQNSAGVEIDSFEMRRGLLLWVFIRKRGHAIGSACSGVGVCGACDVQIVDSGKLSEKTEFEAESLKKHGKAEDRRLACLCRVFDDVTVRADYW